MVFDTSSTLVTKTSMFMIVSGSFAISRFASVKTSSLAKQLNNPPSKELKLNLLYVTLGPLSGFLFVLCLCGSYLRYRRWLARRRNRRVSLHEHPSKLERIGLRRLEPGSGSAGVTLDTAL